jgi:hypothetical protein
VKVISSSHGDEYEDGLPPGTLRHADALAMEVVTTSETSVNFYQSTRNNIPEDGHIRVTVYFWKQKEDNSLISIPGFAPSSF